MKEKKQEFLDFLSIVQQYEKLKRDKELKE